MSFYRPWGATGPGGLVIPDQYDAMFPLAPRTAEWFRANTLGARRAEVIDFFAGGGGFSIGAVLAGADLVLAANHSTRCVDTHSANFSQTEHVLGDLSVINPKRYRKNLANILICAPECRTHSTARNWVEALAELAPWNPDRETERSRCTMWCPQRFAAWMKFDHVLVENVIGVMRWNQIDNWLLEWDKLGYVVQIVSGNSAFFGNEQSRNRVVFVCTRKGLELPNLDFRPPCYCWSCERPVPGVQTWKKAALRNASRVGPVGAWGPRNGQYTYNCEVCGEIASPYILPAENAIDWSIEAPAIGDRARLGLRPLKPKTIERLELALTRVGYVEQLALINGRDPKTQRSRPVWLPAMTQTGRQEIGLFGPAREHTMVYLRGNAMPASPALNPGLVVVANGTQHGILGTPGDPAMQHSLVYLRNNVLPTSVDGNPALAVCASGNHHGLLGVPGAAGPSADAMLAAYNGSGHNSRPAGLPAPTLTGSDRLGLLVPVGGTRQETPVSVRENPAPTRMTRDTHAVVQPPPDFKLEEATFRMIEPHEAVRMMGMHERPDGTPYTVVGKGEEVVRQAGNAIVSIFGANVIDRVLPDAA